METSVNNKCKAFTSLEQSRKLTEILPIGSADMFWADGERPAVWNNKDISLDEMDIPCWSLAALITILPVSCDDGQHCLALINSNPNDATEWLCCTEDLSNPYPEEFKDDDWEVTAEYAEVVDINPYKN